MNDRRYNESHTVTFSEKVWYERMLDYLRFLPKEFPLIVAVSLSLWSFSEIINAATNSPPLDAAIAQPILAISLAAALVRAYYAYRSYVPTVLLTESEVTQAIYRQQKCGWNFAMARQMLSERIARSEASLERIERGAEYVDPKILGLDDYLAWLRRRPEVFQNLARTVATICTSDLPGVIATTKLEADLSRLIFEVDALAGVYDRMRAQELSSHEIVPPEPFEKIHSLTHGWTVTIRDGVGQFLDILDAVAKLDRKALIAGTLETPSFVFTFESPKAVEQFSEALTSIGGNSKAKK